MADEPQTPPPPKKRLRESLDGVAVSVDPCAEEATPIPAAPATEQLNAQDEPQNVPAALNHSNDSSGEENLLDKCSASRKFLDPETVHDRILVVNGKKFYVLEEMLPPYMKSKLAETKDKEVSLAADYFQTSIDLEDFTSFLKFRYWKKYDREVKNPLGLMGFTCHFREDEFWKTVCLGSVQKASFPEQIELLREMLGRNFPKDRVGDVVSVVAHGFDNGCYSEDHCDALWPLSEKYGLENLKETVSNVCTGRFFDATTRDKFIYVELALRHNINFLKDEVAEYFSNFLYPKHRDEIRKKAPEEDHKECSAAAANSQDSPNEDVKFPMTTHGGIYGFLMENRDRLPSIPAEHKAFIMDSMLCWDGTIRHRDVCMVSEFSSARKNECHQYAAKYKSEFNVLDSTRDHDSVLVVSGKKFYVKKGFLKMESTYLNKLFSSSADSEITLQMDDISAQDFEEFLAALYMSSNFPITRERVAGLLRMANKFEMIDHEFSLWEICHNFIETHLSIINTVHVLEDMVKYKIRPDKIDKVVSVLSVNIRSHFPKMDDLTVIVQIAKKLNIELLMNNIDTICTEKFDESSSAEKYAFIELAIENNMKILKSGIVAFLSNFVLRWDRNEEFKGEQDLKKGYKQEKSDRLAMFNSASRPPGIKKELQAQAKKERIQHEGVYSFLLRHRESILSATTEVKAFLLDSLLIK